MHANYDDVILKHYEAEARERGLDSSSTMLDATTRQRETEWILRFVKQALDVHPYAQLCDVGCGNGFTLGAIHEQFPKLGLHGFEFTPQLLELAKQRFPDPAIALIVKGDVRTLAAEDAQFDVLICQRVLINLLNPEDQSRALRELVRVLKPGGLLASIEAFDSPLSSLNAARQEFGFEAIPPAHHNLYLRDDFFAAERSLTPIWQDALPSNFMSSHFFVARVLHPLALGQNPFVRNSHFVRFLSSAIQEPIGDYAPIKGFAFRKQ